MSCCCKCQKRQINSLSIETVIKADAIVPEKDSSDKMSFE